MKEKDINMKYKLINNITKEEHLCDKVTIDNHDYYVSDDKLSKNTTKWYYDLKANDVYKTSSDFNDFELWYKPIIATNNPNIDIPKVIDNVEKLAKIYFSY